MCCYGMGLGTRHCNCAQLTSGDEWSLSKEWCIQGHAQYLERSSRTSYAAPICLFCTKCLLHIALWWLVNDFLACVNTLYMKFPSRYLDSLDPSLFDGLSATYLQMVWIVCVAHCIITNLFQFNHRLIIMSENGRSNLHVSSYWEHEVFFPHLNVLLFDHWNMTCHFLLYSEGSFLWQCAMLVHMKSLISKCQWF